MTMTLTRRLACAALAVLTLITVSGVPAAAEDSPERVVILPPVSCYLYKYYLDGTQYKPVAGGHVKVKFFGYYYGTKNCIGRYRPSTTERAWINETHRYRKGSIRASLVPATAAVTSLHLIDVWTNHEYEEGVYAYMKYRVCFGPLCGTKTFKGIMHGYRTCIQGAYTVSWWENSSRVGYARLAYDRWPIA